MGTVEIYLRSGEINSFYLYSLLALPDGYLVMGGGFSPYVYDSYDDRIRKNIIKRLRYNDGKYVHRIHNAREQYM